MPRRFLPAACIGHSRGQKVGQHTISPLYREPHYRECLDRIAPGAIWNGRVCPLPTGCIVGMVKVEGCFATMDGEEG